MDARDLRLASSKQEQEQNRGSEPRPERAGQKIGSSNSNNSNSSRKTLQNQEEQQQQQQKPMTGSATSRYSDYAEQGKMPLVKSAAPGTAGRPSSQTDKPR